MGDYEEESDNFGNVKKIHYLSGGAVLVQDNSVEALYYGYTDNQGSLIALTDQYGNVVEKHAYDPWGARRNPADWQLKDGRSNFITNRGYTEHEHLDAFNIINMNGRVYDPVTAMFFSPDPFIQYPENWMNYNRYSYCLNNPTLYTDPSGYQMFQKYANDDYSSGSAFYALAQLERRAGIINEGIGGSRFGCGFTGYSFSDAYSQARSEGFKGSYSDFILIAQSQMSSASFDGNVVLHKWVTSGIDGEVGVNSRSVSTYIVRVSGGANFDNANLALDIGGGIYGALSTLVTSGEQWLGINGKYYNNSWGGNQYTGGRSGAIAASNNFKWAGRATVGVSVIIGGIQVRNGYKMDGGRFGYNANLAGARATGGIAGGLAATEAGIYIGGSIGALFGGVGAVPGAIIGGFVFGIAGSLTGNKIGEDFVNYYYGR